MTVTYILELTEEELKVICAALLITATIPVAKGPGFDAALKTAGDKVQQLMEGR